jgi:GntR family transcriptional regulator / MocR family aminotransferase
MAGMEAKSMGDPDTGTRGDTASDTVSDGAVPAAFLRVRPPSSSPQPSGANGRAEAVGGGDGGDGGGAAEASARTWVYRHVSTSIIEGVLWPGLRLPSARALSQAWGIARGGVDEALMRLTREGLIERRVGRGSFVAHRLPPGLVRDVSGRTALAPRAGVALDALAPLIHIAPPSNGAPGATHSGHSGHSSTAAGAAGPHPIRRKLDPRVSDTALFPLAAWRRAMAAAHAEADRSSLCYGMPAGWTPLREATARHLALTRGVECSADQVLILNGPLQALDLVVRVLLEPGDTVLAERPGYMSMARNVGLPPLDLRGAPVDDDGLDVEAARRACPAPALIHVHPLHHYPTGARLSPMRRAALLAWARECRAWVIEADHLGEIVYDGPVPAALFQASRRDAAHDAAHDGEAGSGQVLFLGTFNGLMFPGLRLSYLVVPERLVPAFTAVRGLFGDHTPIGPQQALAAFIDGGHLSAHLRRMREVYRRRRQAVLEAAERHLPATVRLGPMQGGTHGCLHLPPGVADEPLAHQLAAAGFGIEMLSAYSWPERGTGGLVFGYGGDDEARIEAGIAELSNVLLEALGRSSPPGPSGTMWRPAREPGAGATRAARVTRATRAARAVQTARPAPGSEQ